MAAAAPRSVTLSDAEPGVSATIDPAGRRFELLAAIGGTLGRSLDPAETVQAIADAVVPAFADWCVVDLIGPDRSLQMVASAHRDPSLNPEIARLRLTYPPQDRWKPVHAIYRAIDEDATIVETIADEDLAARAVDANHLALLRELGIGSHVVVALESRGRVIGAISMIRAPDRAPFDPDEALTAELVAQRAALATDNAQLYRAAQEAIERRDRFIGVASHELRNPLAVVHGHWDLLRRRLADVLPGVPDADAEQIETSMTRLRQGIQQLTRLVDELLDVRHIADGTMELDRSEVDLAAVVRQASLEAGEAATGRLHLDLPSAPVIGSWDRGRLEQVVTNLLVNALKYSPADASVEVSLADDGEVVRLRVTDAGIGIAPDQLEAIFEPFRRAPNVAARRYPGLGLGLAVSREIATLHGGRIWAESAGEGKGSTFVVELDRRLT
jgi:signal transduction histidine kinase